MDRTICIIGDFDLFAHIFLQSVLPIEVIKKNDDRDIGTCFLIGTNRLLTAKHCIEKMKNVKILDANRQVIRPSSIWTPTGDKDIVLIEFDNSGFNSKPHIMLEDGAVLEEVLTMGYPPIPGFNAINVSETAQVSAEIKASQGRVVAEDAKYWGSDPYYLINAKVKGGNSGGPIINNLGFAIGMIVEVATDAHDQEKLDHLAYGVAVTGTVLKKFLSEVNSKSANIMPIKFEKSEFGFSTF